MWLSCDQHMVCPAPFQRVLLCSWGCVESFALSQTICDRAKLAGWGFCQGDWVCSSGYICGAIQRGSWLVSYQRTRCNYSFHHFNPPSLLSPLFSLLHSFIRFFPPSPFPPSLSLLPPSLLPTSLSSLPLSPPSLPPSTSQELQHVMQISSITLSYKLPSEVFTMLNTLVTLNTQVSSQSHDQHVTWLDGLTWSACDPIGRAHMISSGADCW